jgi:hypothetical protein
MYAESAGCPRTRDKASAALLSRLRLTKYRGDSGRKRPKPLLILVSQPLWSIDPKNLPRMRAQTHWIPIGIR